MPKDKPPRGSGTTVKSGSTSNRTGKGSMLNEKKSMSAIGKMFGRQPSETAKEIKARNQLAKQETRDLESHHGFETSEDEEKMDFKDLPINPCPFINPLDHKLRAREEESNFEKQPHQDQDGPINDISKARYRLDAAMQLFGPHAPEEETPEAYLEDTIIEQGIPTSSIPVSPVTLPRSKFAEVLVSPAAALKLKKQADFEYSPSGCDDEICSEDIFQDPGYTADMDGLCILAEYVRRVYSKELDNQQEWRDWLEAYVSGSYNLESPPSPPERRLESIPFLACIYPPNEGERIALTKGYEHWCPTIGYGTLRTLLSRVDASVAGISLLNDRHEIRYGVAERRKNCKYLVPRPCSLAGHVLYGVNPLVILDTHKDWRFKNNPVVINKAVRFFAAAPLISSSGKVIGVISIVGKSPRKIFTSVQRRELTQFAEIIVTDMELQEQQLAVLGSAAHTGRRLSPPVTCCSIHDDDSRKRPGLFGPLFDTLLPERLLSGNVDRLSRHSQHDTKNVADVQEDNKNLAASRRDTPLVKRKSVSYRPGASRPLRSARSFDSLVDVDYPSCMVSPLKFPQVKTPHSTPDTSFTQNLNSALHMAANTPPVSADSDRDFFLGDDSSHLEIHASQEQVGSNEVVNTSANSPRVVSGFDGLMNPDPKYFYGRYPRPFSASDLTSIHHHPPNTPTSSLTGEENRHASSLPQRFELSDADFLDVESSGDEGELTPKANYYSAKSDVQSGTSFSEVQEQSSPSVAQFGAASIRAKIDAVEKPKGLNIAELTPLLAPLAGTFESDDNNGSAQIYSVPDPNDQHTSVFRQESYQTATSSLDLGGPFDEYRSDTATSSPLVRVKEVKSSLVVDEGFDEKHTALSAELATEYAFSESTVDNPVDDRIEEMDRFGAQHVGSGDIDTTELHPRSGIIRFNDVQSAISISQGEYNQTAAWSPLPMSSPLIDLNSPIGRGDDGGRQIVSSSTKSSSRLSKKASKSSMYAQITYLSPRIKNPTITDWVVKNAVARVLAECATSLQFDMMYVAEIRPAYPDISEEDILRLNGLESCVVSSYGLLEAVNLSPAIHLNALRSRGGGQFTTLEQRYGHGSVTCIYKLPDKGTSMKSSGYVLGAFISIHKSAKQLRSKEIPPWIPKFRSVLIPRQLRRENSRQFHETDIEEDTTAMPSDVPTESIDKPLPELSRKKFDTKTVRFELGSSADKQGEGEIGQSQSRGEDLSVIRKEIVGSGSLSDRIGVDASQQVSSTVPSLRGVRSRSPLPLTVMNASDFDIDNSGADTSSGISPPLPTRHQGRLKSSPLADSFPGSEGIPPYVKSFQSTLLVDDPPHSEYRALDKQEQSKPVPQPVKSVNASKPGLFETAASLYNESSRVLPRRITIFTGDHRRALNLPSSTGITGASTMGQTSSTVPAMGDISNDSDADTVAILKTLPSLVHRVGALTGRVTRLTSQYTRPLASSTDKKGVSPSISEPSSPETPPLTIEQAAVNTLPSNNNPPASHFLAVEPAPPKSSTSKIGLRKAKSFAAESAPLRSSPSKIGLPNSQLFVGEPASSKSSTSKIALPHSQPFAREPVLSRSLPSKIGVSKTQSSGVGYAPAKSLPSRISQSKAQKSAARDESMKQLASKPSLNNLRKTADPTPRSFGSGISTSSLAKQHVAIPPARPLAIGDRPRISAKLQGRGDVLPVRPLTSQSSRLEVMRGQNSGKARTTNPNTGRFHDLPPRSSTALSGRGNLTPAITSSRIQNPFIPVSGSNRVATPNAPVQSRIGLLNISRADVVSSRVAEQAVDSTNVLSSSPSVPDSGSTPPTIPTPAPGRFGFHSADSGRATPPNTSRFGFLQRK